jgi:Cu/Ag efflux pump CusA
MTDLGGVWMVRWIIATSLKYRFLVVFIAALVMLLGLVQLRSMPVNLFP